MSIKQALKMKLPFTRKGLEEYLDECFCNLRWTLEAQTELIFTRLKEEINLQLDRRVNDLQLALKDQIKEEMNLRLDRRMNDLQMVLKDQNGIQAEALFTQLREEMNLQFHRRTNDLQRAVIESLSHNLSSSVANVMDEFYRHVPKHMLSFEVALAEHCNLNCVGCSHFSPLAKPCFADLEEFTRDFKRLAELFDDRTQQIRLMGGEPLLNRDINQFLIVSRECFPHAEILIVTNGLLLPKMDETFWDVCRENQIVISPTYYPVDFDYDAAEELTKSHKVEYLCFAEKGVRDNFWKCAMDDRGLQDCEWNFSKCFAANSCITLQHGRLYTCPIVPTSHYLNEAFGTRLYESARDSIDIYQAESANEILDFLSKPIPFCRYCRKDVAIWDIPWGHSKRELSEWTL